MWIIWTILLSLCLLQLFEIRIHFSKICCLYVITSKHNRCHWLKYVEFREQTFLVMVPLLLRNNYLTIWYNLLNIFSLCLQDIILCILFWSLLFFFNITIYFGYLSVSDNIINLPQSLSGFITFQWIYSSYSIQRISNYSADFFSAQFNTDFNIQSCVLEVTANPT